ncbi:hypothetical protein L6R50_16060 [Myxococcota bacterium]|nr:hypothetical protein [Myxococcota bacterium]
MAIAREFNRTLEGLTAGLASGAGPAPEARGRAQAEVRSLAQRLDTLRGTTAAEAEGDVRRVSDHLGLALDLLTHADVVPGLASRLLGHVLEEQWEIVSHLERRGPGPSPAGAGAAAGGPGSGPRPGGGRPSEVNPLTVGELIGR